MNLYDGLIWNAIGGDSGGGESSVTVEGVLCQTDEPIPPEDFQDMGGFYVSESGKYFVLDVAPDTAIIGYCGTYYECEKQDLKGMVGYGATADLSGDVPSFDFSVYPFFITNSGVVVVPTVPDGDVEYSISTSATYEGLPVEKETIATITLPYQGNMYAELSGVTSFDVFENAYVDFDDVTCCVYTTGNPEFQFGFFSNIAATNVVSLNGYEEGTYKIYRYKVPNVITGWKELSVSSGNSNWNGADVYFSGSGTIQDVDGVAQKVPVMPTGGLTPKIKVCEGDIIVVAAQKQESAFGNGVAWVGNLSASNCVAYQISQTNLSTSIVRYIRVTNVQEGATLTCVAQVSNF